MKNLLIIALVLGTYIPQQAQTTQDFFFNSEMEVKFLGLDFSHVKLIGDFSQVAGIGSKSMREIRDKYFPGWNELMVNEAPKYDIAGMIRRDDVHYDYEVVSSLNASTDPENMEAIDDPVYKKADIANFVKPYANGENKLGIVFIAESLNKPSAIAVFHFAVISMANGQLLLHERMHGRPSGIGIRNYWAGAIHNIIEDIQRYKYPQWKKEAKKKTK